MGMEDEPKNFLILIAQTISLVLMWMMANVLIGIYFGLGFFEGTPDWKNYIYYAGFLISLFFLLKYIKRKWNL